MTPDPLAALRERSSEPHPVYPAGPECQPFCPGPHSEYHDGYSDGYERGEAVAHQALDAALGERDAANEDAERLAARVEHHRITNHPGVVQHCAFLHGHRPEEPCEDCDTLAAHRARVAPQGSET